MRSATVLAGLTTVALVVAACSERVTSVESVFDRLEEAPIAEGETATFSFIQERILTPSCATSGCHNGVTFPTLSAGVAYDNVVDQPSSAGIPQVKPGAPLESFLYIKILGETDDGPTLIGSRMPRGGTPITQGLIDSMAAWIERGAQNDG